ncbi:hypothetical protein G6F46_014497 [Rhizopus delemar]|nr:hypothetical protein G6F46_014497 [Rhizopus delemar]
MKRQHDDESRKMHSIAPAYGPGLGQDPDVDIEQAAVQEREQADEPQRLGGCRVGRIPVERLHRQIDADQRDPHREHPVRPGIGRPPPQGQGKQRGLRGANGEDDGPESHGRRPVGNGMGGEA